MGYWLSVVEEGCSCAGAGREIVMGGGSFHPAPMDKAGVKPGPGWSGACAWDAGRPGPGLLYAGVLSGVNIVG